MPDRFRRLAVHLLRVGLFAAILALIHIQHRRFLGATSGAQAQAALRQITLAQVQTILPAAAALVPLEPAADSRHILNTQGQSIGYFLITSPTGDSSIGFSGPTNILLVCDNNSTIVSLAIAGSRDTREHVEQVRRDSHFLPSYAGQSLRQAAERTHVDAVAGATLTSDAIVEAIVRRLGGANVSVKFPDPVLLAEAKKLFPSALRLAPDPDDAEIVHLYAADNQRLGWCLRTAPAGDNKIGFQGPTEGLIGFNPSGQVVGLILRKSFDNDEYVSRVRDDEYFRKFLNKKSVAELAVVSPKPPDVEGVSGATMTSLAVAEAIVAAARKQTANATRSATSTRWPVSSADIGAVTLIAVGTLIGLTKLRGLRIVRIVWPCVTFIYLGLVAGSLLSQAQLVGWAQSGIPLGAVGLAALGVAALAVPITTKRNLYCSHLCPHGAAQQLIQIAVKPRFQVGRRAARILGMIPAAILAVVVIVAFTHSSISLVDLEPFDAYVLRVAGYATLAIAIVGLLVSGFVPMAYCRFGCPTGAILSFLRRNAHSDRFTRRDWFAVSLLALSFMLCLFL